MPLGALPVVECNRWEPSPPSSDRGIGVSRSDFEQSPSGLAYRDAVTCWEKARAAETLEAAKAERMIALSMAETPTIACQVCGNRFEEAELDIQMRCPGCIGASLQPRALQRD
jgi:predicted Zn-ribbon and HTH transcriptional regulator